MFPRHAAKIGPNTILDGLRYPRLTILCAEGEVIIQRRVGFRHKNLLLQSSLRDDLFLADPYPALKGRAKVSRRYATRSILTVPTSKIFGMGEAEVG